MTRIQVNKELARKLIVRLSPQYAEMLRDLQSPGKWAKLTRRYEGMFQGPGLDRYMELLEDERRIGVVLGRFLWGEEGHKELDESLAAMSLEEQQAWLNELMSEVVESDTWSCIEDMFPDTPEKEAAVRRAFEELDEEGKAKASKQSAYFWLFFFSSFHNYLSVMVHGRKLTTLVAQAQEGDEDAFCMAVHVEPRLLRHHPVFCERHLEASANFLKRIGNQLGKPILAGRIRYPGLYMIFAMLDAVGWLEGGFTHEELLDICDEAGLDRYQNRIEDTNYLTKRLGEYRKWQKVRSLSMQ
jgi:hypothetical protein